MDYIFPFALLLVFYLFIIRPPMTRAKNEKKFNKKWYVWKGF